MKKLIFPLVSLLFAAGLSAQTVDSESQKLIEAFVKSNIDIKMEAVNPEDVSKVFTGNFFKIEVGFVETGTGASSCGSSDYVSINGTTVKMPEAVHMDLECPVLLSLVKKDFMIKNDNDAKLFEAAMNTIYPVEKSEIPNVKFLHKGSQWIFLRGKFFDDYTAFIVTTGEDGSLKKIDLKLAYAVE